MKISAAATTDSQFEKLHFSSAQITPFVHAARDLLSRAGHAFIRCRYRSAAIELRKIGIEANIPSDYR